MEDSRYGLDQQWERGGVRNATQRKCLAERQSHHSLRLRRTYDSGIDALIHLFLRSFSAFDDATFGKKNRLKFGAPIWLATN